MASYIPDITHLTGMLAVSSAAEVMAFNNDIDQYLNNKPFMEAMLSKVSHPDFDEDVEVDDKFWVLDRERVQVINDVAMVSIKGLLTAESGFMEQWMDRSTSYEAIEWTISYLREYHPDVHTLVQLVNSPGGAVSGLKSAISVVSDYVDELENGGVTYNNGTMASAAYAMALSTQVIIGDPWSETGSLGTVIPFMTRARMLKDMGIDVYVARSGKDKFKPSGMEPLTSEDKKILDKMVAKKTELFFELIETERPSLTATKSRWSTGGEYMAKEALDIGLLDAVMEKSTFLDNILKDD